MIKLGLALPRASAQDQRGYEWSRNASSIKCDFLLVSWAALGYERYAEFSALPSQGGIFKRWMLEGGQEVDAGGGSGK